jgi:hypothetical protein
VALRIPVSGSVTHMPRIPCKNDRCRGEWRGIGKRLQMSRALTRDRNASETKVRCLSLSRCAGVTGGYAAGLAGSSARIGSLPNHVGQDPLLYVARVPYANSCRRARWFERFVSLPS